ncbi:mucin-2-like isoform X2 [Ostrea edulis]|uniref:mucin-2-like isoform X2 n=1 Tax=Ostrea edulis TaxID=37623 RepID=UPI0024AEC6A7|nr:mucin-2-like isoform X2 [Ostrea edulis]
MESKHSRLSFSAVETIDCTSTQPVKVGSTPTIYRYGDGVTPYPITSSCTFVLEALDPNSKLLIGTTPKCGTSDTLVIYDGRDNSGSRLVQGCCTDCTKPSETSTGNVLYVSFQSDSTSGPKELGFDLQVIAGTDQSSCSNNNAENTFTVDTSPTIISSPNFPSPYPLHRTCSYTFIPADASLEMKISFDIISLDFENRCFDNITLRKDNSSGDIISTICEYGKTLTLFPNETQIVQGQLFLQFISDVIESSTGFRAIVQQVTATQTTENSPSTTQATEASSTVTSTTTSLVTTTQTTENSPSTTKATQASSTVTSTTAGPGCQDILVNEANSGMVTVTSSEYPNPKDMFTVTGTTEDEKLSQTRATLTFSNNAKISELKVTVTNTYQIIVDILREDNMRADRKSITYPGTLVMNFDETEGKSILIILLKMTTVTPSTISSVQIQACTQVTATQTTENSPSTIQATQASSMVTSTTTSLEGTTKETTTENGLSTTQQDQTRSTTSTLTTEETSIHQTTTTEKTTSTEEQSLTTTLVEITSSTVQQSTTEGTLTQTTTISPNTVDTTSLQNPSISTEELTSTTEAGSTSTEPTTETGSTSAQLPIITETSSQHPMATSTISVISDLEKLGFTPATFSAMTSALFVLLLAIVGAVIILIFTVGRKKKPRIKQNSKKITNKNIVLNGKSTPVAYHSRNRLPLYHSYWG